MVLILLKGRKGMGLLDMDVSFNLRWWSEEKKKVEEFVFRVTSK